MDHEAVVFDLDGTLVRLDVDWDAVAEDVANSLRERGVTPPDSLWDMLVVGEEAGHRDAVEDVISRHERDGARDSKRLPAAETIPDAPVAICSLNCEDACYIAIETHGLDGITAVVGRDTVETEKPDPEPLLEAVGRLGVDPANALFVGDSDRDAEAARRAGIDYSDVADWLRSYR
jgi:phosphoglycolate phosphatase